MTNSSAADLLQQVRDLLNQPNTLLTDDNPGFQDFAKLLQGLNASAAVSPQEVEDLSSYPLPLNLPKISIVLLLTAYSLVICASLLGNSLVLFVILKLRRMHTVTNIFILNVALSDILITGLNIPFSLVRVLMDEWPFGMVVCKIIPFIQVVGVYSSSWTMVCIAIDRLIVTVYPLRPRMRLRTGILLVILVWILSTIAAMPYALIHQTVTTVSFTTSARCIAVYPTPADVYRRYLSLTTFILQFCIPLSITGICYGKIARKLWFTRHFLTSSGSSTGSLQSVQGSNIGIRNRQRSIKMLIVVVVVFSVCWLPISLYHLTRDFAADSGEGSHSLIGFLLLHWLAMSSVCYNPLIYSCWNSCYRSQARILYRFFCFCFTNKGEKEPQKIVIKGLIVQFKGKGSHTDDDTGIRMAVRDDYNSQRSANWDSVIGGAREIVCFREGQRTYKTCL